MNETVYHMIASWSRLEMAVNPLVYEVYHTPAPTLARRRQRRQGHRVSSLMVR